MTVLGHLDGDIHNGPFHGARPWVGLHNAVHLYGASGNKPGQTGARQRRVGWHIPRKRLIKARRRVCRYGERNKASAHD